MTDTAELDPQLEPDFAQRIAAMAPNDTPLDATLEATPDISVQARSYRRTPRTINLTWSDFTQHRNTCAQAALVSVLRFWGKFPDHSDAAIAQDVVTRFPPDLFWGNAGTHPDQLWRAFDHYGLRRYTTSVSNWYPGGFDNGAMNDQFWRPFRDNALKHVNNGNPAIVLLDTGMLTRGAHHPFNLHYVVLHGVHGGYAHFCNDLGDGEYVDGHLPWNQFRRAWECRILPTGAPKFFACFGFP